MAVSETSIDLTGISRRTFEDPINRSLRFRTIAALAVLGIAAVALAGTAAFAPFAGSLSGNRVGVAGVATFSAAGFVVVLILRQTVRKAPATSLRLDEASVTFFYNGSRNLRVAWRGQPFKWKIYRSSDPEYWGDHYWFSIRWHLGVVLPPAALELFVAFARASGAAVIDRGEKMGFHGPVKYVIASRSTSRRPA
ncbi:MAG: hypothetical protein L3K23_02220 [Thermoplasmata archaeon]|nr:hypothetical protein [Thermoplasmata archaeon]